MPQPNPLCNCYGFLLLGSPEPCSLDNGAGRAPVIRIRTPQCLTPNMRLREASAETCRRLICAPIPATSHRRGVAAGADPARTMEEVQQIQQSGATGRPACCKPAITLKPSAQRLRVKMYRNDVSRASPGSSVGVMPGAANGSLGVRKGGVKRRCMLCLIGQYRIAPESWPGLNGSRGADLARIDRTPLRTTSDRFHLPR